VTLIAMMKWSSVRRRYINKILASLSLEKKEANNIESKDIVMRRSSF
jgi:hypothetical protein